MNDLMKILGILAIVAILVCIVMAFLAMIGSVKLTDGCFLRYDNTATGGNVDRITNTVMLDATANYTIIPPRNDAAVLVMEYNPNHYGEWLNTTMNVVKDQKVTFKIDGEVSLCRAYLPKNNLYQQSNLDNYNNQIAIPRVEETNADPVSLIFDAKTDEWRNITQLYTNDKVVVSILPNQLVGVGLPAPVSVENVFNVIKDGATFKRTVITGDSCQQGAKTYSPICGRYSIYSGQYVSKCVWKDNYYKADEHCPQCFLNSSCLWCSVDSGCCARCNDYGGYGSEYKTAPESYQDNGNYTFAWSDDLNKLFFNTKLRCTNTDKVPTGECPDPTPKEDFQTKNAWTINSSDYQRKKLFWYTAPTGLLERIDNNETPMDAKSLGQNYKITRIDKNDKTYEILNSTRNVNQQYMIINNTPKVVNNAAAITYLQYRLWSDPSLGYSNNTGGYVLNIKHTKCRRKNGESYSDIIQNRGKVEYMIVPYSEDPNKSGKKYQAYGITPSDSQGNAKVIMDKEGYVWMRIYNKQEDYKESYGRYKVELLTSEKVGSFTGILDRLLNSLRNTIKHPAKIIFENMTCHGGEKANCTSFFTYIKIVLALYIVIYGGMFMLGIAKINQQDLLIKIIKITIVSGLMNGNTFEFFNGYVIDGVTYFSDAIIANMSGYSMFSDEHGMVSGQKVSNPFFFLEAVMSKILLGKTFSGQILSFLSMGLSGLIYFVIVFIAVMIVIITALRAIAVYVMAFMATALLLGIAPLFLTFMLFDFTKYLFENWVRFTFRYMVEPVVLMAGIIIMTQLFTIYLDFVLGFSVCWKCALPIKVPIPNLPGLPAFLTDMPIFCINWFAPWGMDYRSGMMGVNMQHFVALIIIAYGMYGYVEFSEKIVVKLTNTAGPSATHMAAAMSSVVENKGLEQVGLDKDTRGQIQAEAAQRLKNRNKALDNAKKESKKDSSRENPVAGKESKENAED